MQALKITAHLMSGFVANDAYSPSICGILGYALRREQLSCEQFALDVAHYSNLLAVEDLPLAIEKFNEDWWYQCSFPIYNEQAVFNRYIHRRFNSQEAENYAPDIKKVEATKGPYKNARLLLQQHITNKIEWHVIGNQAEITRLLNNITHIGKRVAGGFGRVRRWDVSKNGNDHLAQFHRALPKAFADQYGIAGDLMQWGIVPPAKNNQRLCVMPCSTT
jgi:CRISPR type IV-associated protein Csf3